MRPFLAGIFVVIGFAVVALAAEQVDAHGRELCSLEDVVLLCDRVYEGGGDREACCHALAAANERGCFCRESAVGQQWVALSEEGLCEFQIFSAGISRCSDAGTKLSTPVRRVFSAYGLRKLGQVKPSSPKHSFVDSPSVSKEDTGDQHTSDKEKVGGYSGVLAAGVGGSLLLSCFMICPCWKPKKKEDLDRIWHEASSEIKSISKTKDGPDTLGGLSESSFGMRPISPSGKESALVFTMTELMKVTKDFSPAQQIGQGGSATVYKGKLKDGTIVAVKRAKKGTFEAGTSTEFRNELDLLSQVSHLHLVKLIGYLEEEHERILVVEYVPNGNLREHLDGQRGTVLDMATRLDISINIAHALTYLHLYADKPIIHRDVKATNILLTDTFQAKVTDFGFSKIGPDDLDATHISTEVKGTAGYLDPEYLTTYRLNTKSDVYSFGILLIELFTGRRPIEPKRPNDERVTVRWAFKKFLDGRVMEVLDHRIEPTPAIQKIMAPLAQLAFACSAPTKVDRPTMKKVQEALWSIRKVYQAQLMDESGPSNSSHTPRRTSSTPGIDSHSSPNILSPHLLSPRIPSPHRSPSPMRQISSSSVV